MSIPLAKVETPPIKLDGCKKEKRDNYKNLNRKQLIKQKADGVAGNVRVAPMVKREDLACEKVIRGVDNNCFIVLGNDRVEKAHTGYGGKGHTQSDSIDIVVGLGGNSPKEVDGNDNEVTTNPNFYIDAARIYISQKTDIDKNFGIGQFGNTGKNRSGVTQDNPNDDDGGAMAAKSGIAVKADNVRIIGRESIRIVTGTDALNSKEGEVLSNSGIEIVAMNKVQDLQPMVLGDNLIQFGKEVMKKIRDISTILDAFVTYQTKFNGVVMSHHHHSPFFGIPTTPSPMTLPAGAQVQIESLSKTKMSIVTHIANLATMETNYLEPSGGNYINSRLNKVN
tara:strand:+ start:785 stop:1795 length:1011 start_codon:yes stop_codon:yes gene_type:complete